MSGAFLDKTHPNPDIWVVIMTEVDRIGLMLLTPRAIAWAKTWAEAEDDSDIEGMIWLTNPNGSEALNDIATTTTLNVLIDHAQGSQDADA